MRCPYRNTTTEIGCDLVEDPLGMEAAMTLEICDICDHRNCPLFREADAREMMRVERPEVAILRSLADRRPLSRVV